MKEIKNATVRELRARAHDLSVNRSPETTNCLIKLLKLVKTWNKERKKKA